MEAGREAGGCSWGVVGPSTGLGRSTTFPIIERSLSLPSTVPARQSSFHLLRASDQLLYLSCALFLYPVTSWLASNLGGGVSMRLGGTR